MAFNQGFGSDATWTTTSNANLNNGANWTGAGGSVPTGIATFNSAIPSVVLTPTTTTDFSVGAINFSNNAQDFTFTITNSSLTCAITGADTDATFHISNTNNTSDLSDNQLFLDGSSSSMGSSLINVSNSASSSTGTMGIINASQVRTGSVTSILDGGQLTITNSGESSNNALDDQNLAIVTPVQFEITSQFTAGENVSISVSNTGINSSDATGTGNSVAVTGNDQMRVLGILSVGNGFTLTLANSGTDSSTGAGSNQVGGIGYNHLEIGGGFTALDNATISLSNAGVNSSSGSNNSTGYLTGVGGQVYIPGFFHAGDFLELNLTNEGTDSSSGSGSNNVGFVDSPQLEIDSACVIGDSATITISNTGDNSSTGDNSFTGYIAGTGQQFLLLSTFLFVH